MKRLTLALAAALCLLAGSQRADAQVTLSLGQPSYSNGPVVAQPYPYGYAPAAPTTGYRSSYYAAPGATYYTPAPTYYAPAPSYYAGRPAYRSGGYNAYAPGWNNAASGGYYSNGYYYPNANNNAVNFAIPGLGNVGFGRR
jgi:hypothetical protein